MEYYTLKLCDLTRKLPLIKVGRHTSLASFSLLGDVELVNEIADQMAARLKKIKFDYLVGPEVRVLPLIHGVALRLGHKRYVVCRETIKSYMLSPVKLEPLPHFPKHVKSLVINGPDVSLIKDKKVIIFDDVVSTGVTMRMIDHLMKKVGANVVGHYAVIKQDESFDPIPDLVYLGKLPIFKTES